MITFCPVHAGMRSPKKNKESRKAVTIASNRKHGSSYDNVQIGKTGVAKLCVIHITPIPDDDETLRTLGT
jgi:hypothetical protein